ncbi:hypothetical protein [Polyangium jinanense]|uniref:Uncharacterized protein n=1 Tax=Polyangium jinanense TaxID=2829994 RepID=A0A9X3WXZ3_9BACT|nr:hypothetical protein [Polyangium jinanense]MDC3952700.1 hypothetical protein [Polyangium jinanense]MDC3980319.1 hypothetical protein [Polyangium jinanense]
MRSRLLLGSALALATLSLAPRTNAQVPGAAPPPSPPPAATNPAPPPPASPTTPASPPSAAPTTSSQANPVPPPPATPLSGMQTPPPAGSAANGASLPPPPTAPPGAGPYAPYPPGPYAPYPPGPYAPPPNGAWGPPPAGPLPGWGAEPPTQKVKRWYGWQTLIGVLVSDVVLIAGQGSAVTYVGLAGHVLTGPIVHWAHGHVGNGFASLGLNVGLPIGGGLIGLMAGAGSYDGWDTLAYTAIGAAVGYFAAPALDMAIFSTETVDEPVEPRKGARALLPSSVAVMPMVGQDRMGLSVVGLF